jgi:transcription elongation factor Elf1
MPEKHSPTAFDCPNCGAGYALVRVEVDEIQPFEQITCRECGGPLNGREGRYILKYFLTDRLKTGAKR